MKKNIKEVSIILIGLLCALVISCADDGESILRDEIYVNIPDENFEKRLIELGIDSDDSLNHRMLRSDAMKVTSLEVDSPVATPDEEKIQDLTGIEAFENLISLSAGNNQIEELNLASNTQLESINLEVNFLKTLDISNNTKLVELSLLFNELTEIEGLNQAQQLKSLNLSWNYLEDLSVNIASLEGLNVENNLLKTLNVEGCSSLTTLIARVNKLESIDLSTNVELKYMTLSSNQIKEMNMDNIVNIEKLWLSWNELNKLNVSNFEVLNLLDIAQNPNLTCVQIAEGQVILTVTKQDYQELKAESCQ